MIIIHGAKRLHYLFNAIEVIDFKSSSTYPRSVFDPVKSARALFNELFTGGVCGVSFRIAGSVKERIEREKRDGVDRTDSIREIGYGGPSFVYVNRKDGYFIKLNGDSSKLRIQFAKSQDLRISTGRRFLEILMGKNVADCVVSSMVGLEINTTTILINEHPHRPFYVGSIWVNGAGHIIDSSTSHQLRIFE